jgi:hypothetical protein
MPFLLAAILFLFYAAEASAMRTTDISERVKFCFSRTDPSFDRLQSFLKAADSVTYSMSGLKAADKTSRCSVIVTNTDMKDGFEINTSGDMLKILLSDDLSRWEKNYTAHSAVISAMLLSRFGIKADTNYGKVPAWMTAGILSKIEMRRNPVMLPGVLVYPGMRGLASGGVQPDLWCIMNNPLEYRDGPSFTLYSETCAVIIDSITKIPKSRDIFMAILKSSVDGKKPDMAFKTAIDDYIMRSGFVFSTLPVEQISQEKRAEIWFGTAIRNSSVSIFFPGSSDFVKKRMDELKTFNCMAATAPAKDKPDKPEQDSRTTEIRSYEIQELGEKWNEIENPERIANIYRGYFIDLSNQSPSLIQSDLKKIAELFNNLKDKDRETFADNFKKAETNLQKKIVRLRQVEDYITESETKFVPFGKKYSTELKYIEETGTFTGAFCPSLNSILDQEEKNF